MYLALGGIIRARRDDLGLDQAALAAQLSVGQQAVSSWERGHSRPRRAMLRDLAQVLSIEMEALLDAGEYRTSTQTVGTPVRPLTRALPLAELTEERFEDLLTELMNTLHPEGHASRYGGRGHKQYGIDILVTALGTNLATGQCKRHREFGPAAVSAAIDEVSLAAPKNYLFLSRLTASPAARAEAGKHARWELWDGEDISRHIRNLPLERAVRIVDTYFPGHREPFLGVPAPGPWLLPEDHFDATRSTIFNHDWGLAGRREELDQLVDAAYQSAATLAFVIGPGGIGKTRLLKALTDAAPASTHVRILPGDTQVTAEDFEFLPHESDLTVVIDDAHELGQFTRIVAGIWRRNPNSRIVIASRPYGLQTLKEGLARDGLLPMPHTEVKLHDLDFDDVMAIAREALGEEAPEAVARRLATLTADSPLVTVVGGVLIKQGQLDPNALEQDEHVRSHIMRGFRDALVNDPLAYDPPNRSAVLDALAALQPFRTNETMARESLSAVVGKPYDQLHKHLRSLEDAGILRRRGDSLRIVPDLLGDIILTEAAFDESNPLGTGYLARIEPLITGSSIENLFINVSRVDWQVRNRCDTSPSLVDSLWIAFQARIQSADVIERRTLAETLVKVAYFQPERALAVTRWLIDNPTNDLNGGHLVWQKFFIPDYNGVLQALPPTLKLAAMNPNTLPEALSQLWELAQADERPTNQHPEHAVRVLSELAEFGLAKPIWLSDRVVDIASTWFVDRQRISPFDVLEPMLATEGEDSNFRGFTVTFRPYSLDPQSVSRVRQRIIELAFKEVCSSDLRRSAAAAKFLKSALRYPTGLFGRPVTNSERDGWTCGFIETIERLGAIAAAGTLDPAVLVCVRDALHWHQNYGDGPVHDAAEKAVASLPNGAESLLALTIHDGWGRLIRGRKDSFNMMEAKRASLIQAILDGVANHSDHEVVGLIISRLGADTEVHGAAVGQSGPAVAALINARPTLAVAMIELFRGNLAPTELDVVLPTILSAFAAHDPAAAFGYITEMLGTTSNDRRRSVSQAIGWNRGLRELHPGELDLLLQLAADPDVVIRQNVARAAQVIARTHTAEATRLLASLRFGDAASLADDIFMSFHVELGISWSNFSESELEAIRQDLLTLPEIGGYWVTQALATQSVTDPAWVIGLLQDRIQCSESRNSNHGYVALPFSWENSLQIRGTPEFLPSLNGVLAWIAEDVDSWQRRSMGADLFAAVANGYDTQVVEVLARALMSGSEKGTLAVAAVLQEAPRTFIWDRPDFVGAALQAAERLGQQVLHKMRGALWSATISGIRVGTPGEPFPETVEQRDRSLRIAKDLPAGSNERRFFTEMAKFADRDILREFEDDLPDDGRDW